MFGRRALLAVATFVLLAPAWASASPEVLTPIFLDGFESNDACEWALGSAACPGFEVFAPVLTAAPGAEIQYCYYFRTGNAALTGARRITSESSDLVTRLDLYTTYDGSGDPTEVQPPGTLDSGICLPSGPGVVLRRMYTAQEPEYELLFPADDGGGNPVALEFEPQQPAILYAVLLNPTVDSLSTAPLVRAHTLPGAATFTRTATFTTHNQAISIPPNAVAFPQTQTCPVPAGAKFWWFSTLTHQRAIAAKILNGASPIVINTDWDSPAAMTFTAPAFYQFGAGEQLTYSCEYTNPNGNVVLAGESYATDEACEGLTYFFPASVPRFCFNSVLLP